MAKSVALFIVMVMFGAIIAVGFNKLNPDFMRYEVYYNHNTNKPCYVLDWQTGEHLQVTKELMDKATGEWTPCDPSLCK